MTGCCALVYEKTHSFFRSYYPVIFVFSVYVTITLYSPRELYCDNEIMSFPSYFNGKQWAQGKRFSCNLIKVLNRFNLREKNIKEVTSFESSDVTLVTYATADHFNEVKAGIAQWRKTHMNKILFIGLDLNPDQEEELQTVCNLELVKFNFGEWPPHIKDNMKHYYFKALILAEAFSRELVFWMIDSSVRFINQKLEMEFYDKVSTGEIEPFVVRSNANHSMLSATHSGMYDYLPFYPSEVFNHMYQSGIMFLVRSKFTREAVKWHVLCALTPDCNAPNGHQLDCSFKDNHFGSYAHCHRYDQSAINIIVTSLREREGKRKDLGVVDSYTTDSFITAFKPFDNVVPTLPTHCGI